MMTSQAKRLFSVCLLFVAGVSTNAPVAAQSQDCTNLKASDYRDSESKKLVLWVSPQNVSQTCANGLQENPLNTIQQAQILVRQWISNGHNSHGVDVNLMPGDYVLKQGLHFTKADSGKPKAPIVYQGVDKDKVRLFGGMIIKPSAFKPVTNTDFKQKLVDPKAAQHILEVTLALSGDALGDHVPHGWMLEPKDRIPPAMLYSGGEKMALARWPNSDENSQFLHGKPKSAGHLGMVSYQSVIAPGATVKGKNRFTDPAFTESGGSFEVGFDRFKHWNKPSEVFLDGILAKSWEWTYNQIAAVDLAQKSITLRRGELSGISANKGSYFHFENIPEELDSAGEFYIDKATATLYFYPPENFENNTTVLATLAEPMIFADKSRFIQFKSMSLDTGRDIGIKTQYAHNMTFTDLNIRNFSGDGVNIQGTYTKLSYSEISNIGGAGVSVTGGWGASFKYAKGGIAQSLKQPIKYSTSNNTIAYNRIHNFAWDQKSQVPGVSVSGIGHKVMFNEIFDGPHFAILFRNSQDVTAAYNYIHHLPKYHKDDGGAIYVGTGNFPHLRGINISGNVLQDIPTNGIYIDNFSSGVQIEKNMMHNVATRNRTFSGININGGGQNMMRHNWFSESPRPIKYNTFAERNVFKNYYPKMKAVQKVFSAPNVNIAPYDQYPGFTDFMNYKTREDFLYQSSSALNNVSVNRVVELQGGSKDGVLEPSDQRWVVKNNVALSTPDGKALELVRMVTSVFALPETNWGKTVQTIAEYLPTINNVIYQISGNVETVSGQGVTALIRNGDFEGAGRDWQEMKATSEIGQSGECSSLCLMITNRKNHIGSAVYTARGLTAGKTYRLSTDLLTKSPMIGLGYSYFKGKKFTNGGWNQGMKIKSNGQWIKQHSWDIELPSDFNPSKGLRLWIRTGGSNVEDIYLDNISLEQL